MECQVFLEVSFTESTNKKMKHAFSVVDNRKSDAPSLVVSCIRHYTYIYRLLFGEGTGKGVI
jgi:hypothetical protein